MENYNDSRICEDLKTFLTVRVVIYFKMRKKMLSTLHCSDKKKYIYI